MFKNHPEDNLFNRRLMAFGAIIFTVLWSVAILTLNFLKPEAFEAAKLIAFLGVPGSLAGLNLWKYLKAAEEDDSA